MTTNAASASVFGYPALKLPMSVYCAAIAAVAVAITKVYASFCVLAVIISVSLPALSATAIALSAVSLANASASFWFRRLSK